MAGDAAASYESETLAALDEPAAVKPDHDRNDLLGASAGARTLRYRHSSS